MDPLIERRIWRRVLTSRAQSADMWRTMSRKITELFYQTGVKGEGGVDPAEGINGLSLDSGPGIKDAVNGIAQVLLGCCQH